MAEPAPSAMLMISQLPAGIDEKMVRQVLTPYGTIKSVAMLGRAARITFVDESEAKWIRDNLDGNIPEGFTEPVTVRYASTGSMAAPAGKGGGASKGYEPYSGGSGGGGYGGSSGNSWSAGGKGAGPAIMPGGMGISMIKNGLRYSLPGSSWKRGDPELYVGGLPPDTTDVDLYEIFSPFGAIPPRGVKAMLSPEGQCTGIGFVNYLKYEEAQMACQTLNGTMLPNGQMMRVQIKRSVNVPMQQAAQPAAA